MNESAPPPGGGPDRSVPGVPPAAPRAIRSRRLVLSLGSAALLLAICEGAARIGYRPRGGVGAEEAWQAADSATGWARRPDFRGVAYATEHVFERRGLFPSDARGIESRPARLILAVGDSRTFGVGVRPEQTWVEQLQAQLPETEVVNLGVPAYSAWQGRVALQNALADPALARPDTVVFAFGFNDRRYVLRADEADSAPRFARLARRGRWRRLFARSVLVERAAGRPASGRVAGPLDLATVHPRLPPAAYRRELDAVATLCAARGIALVLLWLPDNPEHARDLRAGERAAAAGRNPLAQAALERAVAADNTFSDAARRELASLLETTGRTAEASAARVSPRRFHSVAGGYPILSARRYAIATREVARARGSLLVDATASLEAEPAAFLDFVHFDARGHRVVAALVAARLAAEPPPDHHGERPRRRRPRQAS